MKNFISKKGNVLIQGLIAIILTLSLASCGNMFEGLADKDSYAAKIEAARIAIDKRDYEGALSILNEMDQNDAKVKELKSNAYAGKVGIDTFNLLQTIDTLSDKDNVGGIDMVGTMLGGADAILSYAEISQKINDLTDAIDTLLSIGMLTDAQKIQLGLLSLSRATLTIALIISEDKGGADVKLTDDGIEDQYSSGSPPDFSDVPDITGKLATLSTDILHISDAILAISCMTGQKAEENDLSNNFNEFKNDLDTNRDNQISPSELQNYAS